MCKLNTSLQTGFHTGNTGCGHSLGSRHFNIERSLPTECQLDLPIRFGKTRRVIYSLVSRLLYCIFKKYGKFLLPKAINDFASWISSAFAHGKILDCGLSYLTRIVPSQEVKRKRTFRPTYNIDHPHGWKILKLISENSNEIFGLNGI